MKTKNNNKMALIGLLGLLSAPAFAQYVQQFPVLRTEGCEKQIIVPEGANAQYYLSKNCKTAYILPSESVPLEISSVLLTAHVTEAKCDLVTNADRRAGVLTKQLETYQDEHLALIKKWALKLEQASPEQLDKLRENAEKIIAASQKSMDDLQGILNTNLKLESFAALHGAEINFKMGLAREDDVKAFQAANVDADLKIQTARISSGTLSFAAAKPASMMSGFASVLGLMVPAINAKGKDFFADSNHIVLNGGISGIMTLSLPTICGYIRELSPEHFDRKLLTEGTIKTAGFAANYTYDVPVTTNVVFSLKADTTPKQIRTAFSGSITKDKFTQEDVSNLLMEGVLSTGIEIEYKDGGQETKLNNSMISEDRMINFDEENVYTLLYQQGMDIYLKKILKKMEQVGDFQRLTVEDVDPIEGGDVVNESRVRHCKWKTNWYGKKRHECGTSVVRNVTFQKGVSTLLNTVEDNSAIELDFNVDTERTMAMTHTSTFVEKHAVK